MQQQEQGNNAWIGGSIGTGLGVLAARKVAEPITQKLVETLSKDKMFVDKLNDIENKRWNAPLVWRDKYNAFANDKPYEKAYSKVEALRQKSWDKALPYGEAAELLLALGTPITAGLLGSTLTD